MTGSRRLAILAALAVAASWPAIAPAQRLEVDTRLDRPHIALGEEATLTVTVTADGLDVPPIETPAIRDVDVRRMGESQGLSFSGGRVTRSVSVAYLLHPHKAGIVRIPAIRVTSGGTTAASEPLTLSVGADRPTPSPASTELFARLTLDRNAVYWNQQVVARYTVYTRVELAAPPVWDPPDAPGFWSESLGQPRSGRVTIDGVPFLATEFRVAYFPTRTGTLTLGPGRVHVQAVVREPPGQSWGLWSPIRTGVKSVELQTERAEVRVAPLPPDAPGEFKGAVGRYSLDVRVDRKETRAGEPVTVETVVRGEGNVASAGDPAVTASTPARSYAAGGSTRIDRSGPVIRGERRHEVALVPEAPGVFTVLPVRFAWFDPEEARFRVQSSDSIPIRVAAPSADGESLRLARGAGPIASLRTRPGGPEGSLGFEPPLAARIVGLGSMLAYAVFWAVTSARDRAGRDPRRVRRRKLEALIREMEAMAGRAGPGPAARVAEILAEAAGLRYGVDAAGRPDREVLEAVRAAGASHDEAATLAALLGALEREAFAPPDPGSARSGQVLEDALALVRAYERGAA